MNVAEERVILGRLLLSPDSFFLVADVLKAEHFAVGVHQRIYGAIRDILMDGKKLSLTMIESRVGEEYDDGKSTMILMTGMLRDAEEGGDLDGVDLIVDLWRHRQHIAELERALKEAKKPNANSADLIADHLAHVDDITSSSQSRPFQTLGQLAQRVALNSKKARETGVISGFDTGLPSLDQMLGRIHRGDLGVVGARQGDGKTIIGLQIANWAEKYDPAILFEYEMDQLDLAKRALAARTSLTVSQISEGSYDFDEAEEMAVALEAMQSSRCIIEAEPKMRLDQIRNRCLAVKRSRGLGLVVIDHLRLIRVGSRFNNKFDRIEHVTGELKSMAKDLDIAVIVLSQVTRASQRDDKHPEPGINDLDGGSSIEQDADWILGMFRRDRWLKTKKPYSMDSNEGRAWVEQMHQHRNKIEIAVLKRRRGEDGEMREFEFDGRAGLIREL